MSAVGKSQLELFGGTVKLTLPDGGQAKVQVIPGGGSKAPRAVKAPREPFVLKGMAAERFASMPGRARPTKEVRQAHDHSPAFAPARPAPGVVPKHVATKMAKDEVLAPFSGWAAGTIANFAFNQGYSFLGYPYLSELAQVPEYRLISEVISSEATRKWIKITSKSDESLPETAKKEKSSKIKDLEAELDRLKAKKVFEMASMQDGFFGRSHIYIDTGDTDNPRELMKPIGAGGEFSARKFRKGFFRGVRNVEPVWAYPQAYNSTDPLGDDWYKPEIWYCMSKGVHVTRLMPMVAKPVPDLLKPAFMFGGLSLTQMAKPYVDNWLETRQSVNDVINAFSVMVLKTDLQAQLAGQGDSLEARAAMFNYMRDNRGLFMLNKDSEEFDNVSAPLGSLDKLQAQAQEHMSTPSRIPLVKLFGITPSGLNNTTDGEIDCFEDTIHAYQEHNFRDPLTVVFRLAQINLWGAVDPDLLFTFEPLKEESAKEKADRQKVIADTHKTYVDMSAVAPEEVRQSLADDTDAPYTDIDVDDVPEPVLESEHVRETEEVGGAGGTEED